MFIFDTSMGHVGMNRHVRVGTNRPRYVTAVNLLVDCRFKIKSPVLYMFYAEKHRTPGKVFDASIIRYHKAFGKLSFI